MIRHQIITLLGAAFFASLVLGQDLQNHGDRVIKTCAGRYITEKMCNSGVVKVTKVEFELSPCRSWYWGRNACCAKWKSNCDQLDAAAANRNYYDRILRSCNGRKRCRSIMAERHMFPFGFCHKRRYVYSDVVKISYRCEKSVSTVTSARPDIAPTRMSSTTIKSSSTKLAKTTATVTTPPTTSTKEPTPSPTPTKNPTSAVFVTTKETNSSTSRSKTSVKTSLFSTSTSSSVASSSTSVQHRSPTRPSSSTARLTARTATTPPAQRTTTTSGRMSMSSAETVIDYFPEPQWWMRGLRVPVIAVSVAVVLLAVVVISLIAARRYIRSNAEKTTGIDCGSDREYPKSYDNPVYDTPDKLTNAQGGIGAGVK